MLYNTVSGWHLSLTMGKIVRQSDWYQIDYFIVEQIQYMLMSRFHWNELMGKATDFREAGDKKAWSSMSVDIHEPYEGC